MFLENTPAFKRVCWRVGVMNVMYCGKDVVVTNWSEES
jgi:hypothetical protein